MSIQINKFYVLNQHYDAMFRNPISRYCPFYFDCRFSRYNYMRQRDLPSFGTPIRGAEESRAETKILIWTPLHGRLVSTLQEVIL